MSKSTRGVRLSVAFVNRAYLQRTRTRESAACESDTATETVHQCGDTQSIPDTKESPNVETGGLARGKGID